MLIKDRITTVNNSTVSFSDFLKNINEEDQYLLKVFVRHMDQTSQAYEHSWGYVIQATRYGKFRLYDPRTSSLIFFGRKSGVENVLVVPTFFATPSYLAIVLPYVQELIGASYTVLKNIDPKEKNLYLPYGFRPYNVDEVWDEEAKFDDQTFPQLLIDLETLTKMNGSEYRKLRKYLRRGNKFTIRPYHFMDESEVFKLLALKDKLSGSMTPSLSRKYTSSHNMYPSSSTDKYIIEENGQVVGFTVTSEITPECIAFCAGIFLPHNPEIAPWSLYHTLELKYQQGYKIANLGGSESLGTFEFKNQLFKPTRKIQRTHLIYEG